ncbi:MAG TPA: hypothetical protein VHD36_01385 [Pirellulales bacterium]|nr:hypothetical protein [Pirellulales bacterium]
MLSRLLDWLGVRYDCVSDAAGTPYFHRWTLFGNRWCSILFHKLTAGDEGLEGNYHDHPWWFLSLKLWNGYREGILAADGTVRYRRHWPGTLHFLPAETPHRVELLAGRPAYSLVLTGPVRRNTVFYTPEGPKEWGEYMRWIVRQRAEAGPPGRAHAEGAPAARPLNGCPVETPCPRRHGSPVGTPCPRRHGCPVGMPSTREEIHAMSASMTNFLLLTHST